MARFASQAEYLRHHRACFELALQEGITPAEAAIELDRRAALKRFRETHARFLEATAFPPRRDGHAEDAAQRDQPWMMRD